MENLGSRSEMALDLKIDDRIPSQVREHSLGTGDTHIASGLDLRVCDVAMVNHHRVSRGPLALGPADTLRELRADVGEEEL